MLDRSSVILIKQILLEKVKLSYQYRISGVAIATLGVDAYADIAADALVCFLQATLAGKRISDDVVEAKYPDGWWQAVRERWAPAWWLRRWPVRYRTIAVRGQVYRICPHMAVPEGTGNHYHVKYLEEGK